MTAAAQRQIVERELAKYAHGPHSSSQNVFRSAYWNGRLNSLGKNPQLPDSPEVVAAWATEMVRRGDPTFTPVRCDGNRPAP